MHTRLAYATKCKRPDFTCSPRFHYLFIYDSVKLDLGYRLDLVVEDLVIVEIKAVEAITAVHQAQLLSYLKLSGKALGLLINFNVAHLKEGIKRMVVGTNWK